MSFFTQPELHCTSQDVCLRFSPVGKSVPFDQIFDEIDRIQFSNRKGRNLDSEPRFFQFDGGSFGYIKVSISPTFYENIFCAKFFCTTFIYSQFGFVIFFCWKNIVKKLLVKCWWNWQKVSKGVPKSYSEMLLRNLVNPC